MNFLVTRYCSATRAHGLVPLPQIVGSICKLDIPASFWRRLLTCPAKPCARTEFASRLAGAASSVVCPRAGRLMILTGGEGGSEVYSVLSRSRGPIKLRLRLYC